MAGERQRKRCAVNYCKQKKEFGQQRVWCEYRTVEVTRQRLCKGSGKQSVEVTYVKQKVCGDGEF